MASYTLKRESCWVSVFCVPILSRGEAVVEGDANWLVTEWLTVLHSFSTLSLSCVEMEGSEPRVIEQIASLLVFISNLGRELGHHFMYCNIRNICQS